MRIKNTKKYIAAVAALQILLYHCWIPVFKYGTAAAGVERFLVASTYSGVDIFFFLSAYSLVLRPVENYGAFIKNRAIKILPLFFIAWALGHFIWFLPAIMVVYLIFPPLYKLCRKRPVLAFPLLIIGWACITYLILGFINPAQDLGIFLFRIPAIILGAYAGGIFGEREQRLDPMAPQNEPLKPIVGALLLAAGTLLVYKFGYVNKLQTPFKDTFYLVGIPTMLGTIILVDWLGQKLEDKNRVQVIPREVFKEQGPPEGRTFGEFASDTIKGFGSLTLELYFSQMVLGTYLINSFYAITSSRLLTNLITIAIIIIVSKIINWISEFWMNLI